MFLGIVIGNVVATVKIKEHENFKILVVKPIDTKGNFIADSVIALDIAQAGMGDCVLVMQEGGSISGIIGGKLTPVDALIVGVIDYIAVDGKQIDLTVVYES
ncbi:MAG: EutN/CcmL family microcompartment protein [Candidatus Hodarchaeales archaeon]|jgi:ethanolamine utilization protein EutN